MLKIINHLAALIKFIVIFSILVSSNINIVAADYFSESNISNEYRDSDSAQSLSGSNNPNVKNGQLLGDGAFTANTDINKPSLTPSTTQFPNQNGSSLKKVDSKKVIFLISGIFFILVVVAYFLYKKQKVPSKE